MYKNGGEEEKSSFPLFFNLFIMRDENAAIMQLSKKGVIVNNGDNVVRVQNSQGEQIMIFQKGIYLGSARATLGLSSLGNIDFLKSKGFSVFGQEDYDLKFFRQ